MSYVKKAPTVPYVRYKHPEKEGVFERISAAYKNYSLPGTIKYDAEKHKGHLYCMGCDARMHHNKGSDKVLANDGINFPPHLKSNPNQEHAKGCSHHDRIQQNREDYEDLATEFDAQKGYSLLVKIDADLSPPTGVAAYTREKDPESKRRGRQVTVINNPLLVDLERVSVRSMCDVAAALQNLDPKRLMSGFAVRNDKVIPWGDFFVRYNRKSPTPKIDPDTGKTIPLHHPRFENLYTTLKQTGKPQMCMMEIRADFVVPEAEAISIQSRKVRFERCKPQDYCGLPGQDPIYLNPKVYLETKKNPELEGIMQKGKKYLVFGEVRLKENAGGKSANLTMSVTKLDQIVEIDLDTLFAGKAMPPQTPPAAPVPPTPPTMVSSQPDLAQAAKSQEYRKPEQLCLQLNASFG